eukprot:Selendium_serpulae@DN205_c0_g1_i1.p1
MTHGFKSINFKSTNQLLTASTKWVSTCRPVVGPSVTRLRRLHHERKTGPQIVNSDLVRIDQAPLLHASQPRPRVSTFESLLRQRQKPSPRVDSVPEPPSLFLTGRGVARRRQQGDRHLARPE